MSEGQNTEVTHSHDIPDSVFWKVFGGLAILTFLTYGMSFLSLSHGGKLIASMTISIAKASLVIAFFMQLKYEKKFLSYMFLFPFLLALIFTMLIMPDISASALPRP